MGLERTPLRSLEEIGPRAMSAKPSRHPSLATIKKLQVAGRRNRFKIARLNKRPSVQKKRKRTERMNKGRGLVKVGGRTVRKGTANIARRIVNRMRKIRHTGSYSPFHRSSGSDMGYMTKVEAYEALVSVLQESIR